MFRTAIFLLACFASCVICGDDLQSARIIRLASGEWKPYQSRSLPGGGSASKIVTAAFANQGLTVEYSYFPWKRSLKLASQGKFDGTFLWFASDERARNFYISDPVVNIDYLFFFLKESKFDWQSV
jgi:polar amino acid transport system substrate-binding protein